MDAYVKNLKVLYVDDEPALLSSFTSLFWREGLQVHTLVDSTAIDSLLDREGPFALVISDQRMPGLDGVATLQRVQARHPDTIRVVMTGFADLHDTQRAINDAGISRYITKPWDDEALKGIMHDCVALFNLGGENRNLTSQLLVQNKVLAELLEGTVGESVRFLSHLVSYINPHASNQTERVRRRGLAVLDLIPEIHPEERWAITRSFDLFNLGIALLPTWIQLSLVKEGLKAIDRFPAARNHHIAVSELLKDIPRFSPIASIIRYQYKDFDGTGEPRLEILGGKSLPLGSRLLHILIDLDTLSTEDLHGRDVLRLMADQPRKYDVELISMMLGGGDRRQHKFVRKDLMLDELIEAMVLVYDVTTKDGEVVLQEGSVITDASIRILRQWQLYDQIQEPIAVEELL